MRLPSVTFKLYNKVYHSRKLATLLQHSECSAQQEEIRGKKIAVDKETFELLKTAAVSASSLLQSAKDIGGRAAGHAGKGLAFGAGAAVPAAIAGKYLIDEGTTEARDKALQAGLGMAAIGGGLYGLHRALPQERPPPRAMLNIARQMQSPRGPVNASLQYAFSPDQLKQAGTAEGVTLKFASIGYLDTLIEEALKTTEDPVVIKMAENLRSLNQEAAVSLLHDIVT